MFQDYWKKHVLVCWISVSISHQFSQIYYSNLSSGTYRDNLFWCFQLNCFSTINGICFAFIIHLLILNAFAVSNGTIFICRRVRFLFQLEKSAFEKRHEFEICMMRDLSIEVWLTKHICFCIHLVLPVKC